MIVHDKPYSQVLRRLNQSRSPKLLPILADMLRDKNDPRADGLLWLAEQKLRPLIDKPKIGPRPGLLSVRTWVWFHSELAVEGLAQRHNTLPADVFEALSPTTSPSFIDWLSYVWRPLGEEYIPGTSPHLLPHGIYKEMRKLLHCRSRNLHTVAASWRAAQTECAPSLSVRGALALACGALTNLRKRIPDKGRIA